jgi:hypothetical protein
MIACMNEFYKKSKEKVQMNQRKINLKKKLTYGTGFKAYCTLNGFNSASVADPGCFIPDPGSDHCSIPDPDPGSGG